MGVVVIMESQGDRDQLLAACDEVVRRSGPAEGLLVRVVAPTEQGFVLIHVWESDEARARWHDNPRHRQALRASGMTELVHERTVRELHTHHIETAAIKESR